ncbi:MAG: hypothetical protein D3906_02840, partial [Candidatus Electrothrix sp. AUS1_2]|nr:hypothetical protein [Candidatus Electrothrix sp. AUS1_2]
MKKKICSTILCCVALFCFFSHSYAVSQPILSPMYLLLLSRKTPFDADEFLKDAAGILAEQAVEQTMSAGEEKILSAENTLTEDFMGAWYEKIADTGDAHALMGFIDQEAKTFLKALEDSGWYYEKQGGGTLELSRESETVSLSYYSTPLAAAEGHAAMIYLGRTTPYNYEQFPYRSDTPLPPSEQGDNTVLVIKEAAGKKLLYWVSMEKYADMPDSSWNVVDDFVTYQRTADTPPKTFPAINRAKDGAGGGRAILLMTDSTAKEAYFEYLVSTEKENDQEHIVIRLTDLDDSGDKLRIGEESGIHLSYVVRQGSTTTVGSQTVDLVNDEDSLLIEMLVQGSIRSGMKLLYSASGLSIPLCIKLPASLNIFDFQFSPSCSAAPLALPAVTSDFSRMRNDPDSFVYLPSAGSTYSDIDLRVNLHALFTAEYDEKR